MLEARPLRRGNYPADRSAPWLSILLPVYNVAPYLRECIESIISQGEDPGIEIIMLDDASTDGSLAVCEDLCRDHPGRVSLLRHETNRGLSAARNTLLNAAGGKYVWFVDSDDYLLPGSIAELRQIVTRHEPEIILCDYRKVRKNGRLQFKTTFSGLKRAVGTCRHSLLGGVFAKRKMYAWARVSKRTLWADNLRFPEGRHFEDIATTPLLLLRAKSYYNVGRPWIHYRTTPGSIMDSVTRQKNFF